MYKLSFHQRKIHFAGRLKKKVVGCVRDILKLTLISQSCGSLANLSLGEEKNHIVPNLDIIERVSVLIAFLLMRIFSCFSVNTSLTFSLCNLIRVLLY